ncbi:MAG: substrate-binding domain-containing protein [Pelomonas sp.]|nr:substrate-binding domain-containing protein [Roseateles sp.]
MSAAKNYSRRACLGTGLGLGLGLALPTAQASTAPVRIGFLVKQAEEPWFQDEWRYAGEAAAEKGFALIRIGVPGGEKTLDAIATLAALRAQGFVICAPDVKLGTAIERTARRYGIKVMSVDDRLVDGLGHPIEAIPHMGISAYEIGRQVGRGLLDAAQAGGWSLAEVGAMRIAFDELPTARERTRGAVDALVEAGFPAAQIVDAPSSKSDTENAFNAATIALTKNPRFKRWFVFAMNDEMVLGGVRAAEGRGLRADAVAGIGIGGSQTALNEFARPDLTGFAGTVLISPRRHGYETSIDMYRWITTGEAPPPLTLTTGIVVTRANLAEVRRKLGL